MSNKSKIRIGIAVVVLPLIIIGLIFSIKTGDQTTFVMTVALAAVYGFYLYRFIPVIKKDVEEHKQQSPLDKRR